MIIGVGLDARLGLDFGDLATMGGVAAQLGFESIWTPAGGIPDAFHVCGAWSEASSHPPGTPLRTGVGVVPAARMWNPISLAIQAATASLRGEGGFVLGIGTGGAGAAFFEAAGLPNRPISVSRDYLAILRGLLAGERVTYQGDALHVEGEFIGKGFPPVPVYLAALGPQMLALAGTAADGVCLNWCTPSQIAQSREIVGAAALAAGRSVDSVPLSMYIRVCVDEDVAVARRAFAGQVLGYAMARPDASAAQSYRQHFGRMGFDEVLLDLEERRAKGATTSELIDAAPDDFLRAFGYFGTPKGAATAFRSLAEGLDEVIVRVIIGRPGIEPVQLAMEALTPALIRAA